MSPRKPPVLSQTEALCGLVDDRAAALGLRPFCLMGSGAYEIEPALLEALLATAISARDLVGNLPLKKENESVKLRRGAGNWIRTLYRYDATKIKALQADIWEIKNK